MPTTHTFANLCARLNRSPVYIRGLQRRFGLPIPTDSPTAARRTPITDHRSLPTDYTSPYFSFLETIIHLRVLGIPEETLLHDYSGNVFFIVAVLLMLQAASGSNASAPRAPPPARRHRPPRRSLLARPATTPG